MEVAAKALSCVAGIDVHAMHARDPDLSSAADLRTLLKTTVGTGGANAYVIANFHGDEMGLNHFGHYSPVVAYAPASDMALVLDVSRFKYVPWWAPVELLWKGVDTADSVGIRRGVMAVRQK